MTSTVRGPISVVMCKLIVRRDDAPPLRRPKIALMLRGRLAVRVTPA
jgi:hypothetical protein